MSCAVLIGPEKRSRARGSASGATFTDGGAKRGVETTLMFGAWMQKS